MANYYFGKIGKMEYNSEIRECEIVGGISRKSESIVIMNTQIGNSIQKVKENTYKEVNQNGFEAEYKYINDGKDLEINWKWVKPKSDSSDSSKNSTNSKENDDLKEESDNEYNYVKNYIPLDKDNKSISKKNGVPIYSRRRGIKLNVKFITIHSTGNANSNSNNERNWLINTENNRSASYHIVVDDKQAIEVIPLNEVAYHCGNTIGNNSSIGIEICHSGNRSKTLSNTIDLVASLLKKYNFNTSILKRHYDWTSKNCPSILIDNKMREKEYQTWEWFINEVKSKL
jgi:hypothetical protein